MEPSNKVEQRFTIANGERFIHGTYNNIAIIIRERDGFVNATTMCNQFNRRFRKINENHAWLQYLEAFKKEYYSNSENEPMYQINKGIPDKAKELRGTYVDPRLMNYIAIWSSPVYAICVGKIMDSINERGKAKLISDEENMNEVLTNLKNEVEELKKENAKLIEAINEKEQTINQKEELIFEEAVRSGVINDRKLTLFCDNNDEGKIKMSADNRKKFNAYILQYTFPASMNIRMMIKNELRIKTNGIKINDYERVKAFLDSLNPKSRVEGEDYF